MDCRQSLSEFVVVHHAGSIHHGRPGCKPISVFLLCVCIKRIGLVCPLVCGAAWWCCAVVCAGCVVCVVWADGGV